MPLLSIIGISGSGKSTVLKNLQKRGFDAHGIDEEGLADWVDRKTGLIVPFPYDNPNIDIHNWYEKHRWVSSEVKTAQFKAQADKSGDFIFLVGMAEDEYKVRHLYDKVIYLSVDEKTLKDRIANRADNEFGKTPEEWAAIQKWMKENDALYRNSGAVVLDAHGTEDEVIDKIIAIFMH